MIGLKMRRRYVWLLNSRYREIRSWTRPSCRVTTEEEDDDDDDEEESLFEVCFFFFYEVRGGLVEILFSEPVEEAFVPEEAKQKTLSGKKNKKDKKIKKICKCWNTSKSRRSEARTLFEATPTPPPVVLVWPVTNTKLCCLLNHDPKIIELLVHKLVKKKRQKILISKGILFGEGRPKNTCCNWNHSGGELLIF